MGVKRVLIPHSGNGCSGLCQPPCLHPDCWQCADMATASKALAASEKRRLERRLEREREIERAKMIAAERAGTQKSILAAMPASLRGQPTTVREQAIVERSVLEDIVRRAGMTMSWNDGRPVFGTGQRQSVEGGSFEDAMRSKGASEEDIAAARKVMGGDATTYRSSTDASFIPESFTKVLKRMYKQYEEQITWPLTHLDSSKF